MPIHIKFANPSPIRLSNPNSIPICQSITNSSPIWPLHAPISANRKNRTVTDRQDIGTHWHRSRQSRERMGNKFTTVHRQLTIEDQSIRTQIATQSPLNQEPIGNQSVRTLYRDLMELALYGTYRSVSRRHHSQLTADTPIHRPIRSIVSAVPIHRQSNINPFLSIANLTSIRCQSIANRVPI